MKTKSFEEMLDLICQNLETSPEDKVAYTMLLGAGFSYGVIPTAKEILIDAPVWLYEMSNKRIDDDKKVTSAEIAKDFWVKIKTKFEGNGSSLEFDKDTGIPKDSSVSEAYKLLMSANCPNGLTTPSLRREYIRYLCQNANRKNNPAHLYLACLLNHQRKKDRIYKAKFCQTILTTNFDPLLQDALQLVNVLYYMSDRPEVTDHLQEDSHNAIHLVYTHGSIHRYLLLNSEDEIKKGKSNSSSLKTHFERHGVIVMGYGGWEDATMTALQEANQFDGNLYWCVRSGDTLSADVEKLLEEHSACSFKVIIPDADEAMNKIFERLTGLQLPEFMGDPIAMIIEQMDGLSFTETKNIGCNSGEVIGNIGFSNNFNSQIDNSIKRLRIAREAYKNPEQYNSKVHNEDQISEMDIQSKELEYLKAQAVASKYLAEALHLDKAEDFMPAIAMWSKVLDIPGIPSEQKVEALINRADTYCKLELPKTEKAITDCTTVIEMPDVSAKDKAMALSHRAIAYCDLELPKTGEAIADYTAIIEMPDASAKDRARALHNRAITYTELEPPKTEEAIADQMAIIEMPDAPTEYKARALCSRACTYTALDSAGLKQKIIYCTSVIEEPDTFMVCKSTALLNRANSYQRLKPPKTEEAITDYAAIIEMPDATAEQKIEALLNRADIYCELEPSKTEEAIAAYMAVIKMPEVLDEQKGNAHGTLGLLYFKEHNDIQGLLEETHKALKYHDCYAWNYNLGLAKLFLGEPDEALEYCIPAIDECCKIDQIDGALLLLKSKKSILPEKSRAAYENIMEKIEKRREELR